jgi:hypothetical protein
VDIGGGYQGDMLLPPKSALTRGAAFNGEMHRWPNRVIPYDISAITSRFLTKLIYFQLNNRCK